MALVFLVFFFLFFKEIYVSFADKVIAVLQQSAAFETLRYVMYLTTYDALTAVSSQYEVSNC